MKWNTDKMPELFTCRQCGARYAKLDKLRCDICEYYRCPACDNCYCDYETRKSFQSEFKVTNENTEKVVEENPVYKSVTVEYAKYLKDYQKLELKGNLEYLGQRVHTKNNKNIIISDFMFYDSTDSIPLRVFGPVPSYYFPVRMNLNKVILRGVSIHIYRGEFELILSRTGKILLLKDKSIQSLFKFLDTPGMEKMEAKSS